MQLNTLLFWKKILNLVWDYLVIVPTHSNIQMVGRDPLRFNYSILGGEHPTYIEFGI